MTCPHGSECGACQLLGRTSAEQHAEKNLFTRIDLVLILAEIGLVALMLISLASGSGQHINALQSVMGGPYTLEMYPEYA